MNYITTREIVSKIFRDINITETGWIEDAYVWVGEALQYIGTNYNKYLVKKEITVTEKTKIPCDLQDLEGIVYNGCFLKFQNNRGFFTKEKTGELIPYINNGYIYLNTKTPTTVTLYYLAFMKDCEGNVLFEDHIILKEAILNYVLMKLLGSGYQHPVFNYKETYLMWEKLKERATAYCNFPTPLEIENALQHFENPIIVAND